MIYFPKSKGQISHELPVVAGATIVAEGQCLMANTVAGVFGVQPSTASDGTKRFMGFSVSEQMTLVSFPKVEDFILGAGGVFVLSRVPSSGIVLVYDVTVPGTVVTANGGGAGTGWTLTSNSLAISNSLIGHEFRVFYRFAPTVVEAQSIQGDIRPGGPAALLLNQVGVLKSGIVYTSEYDVAVSWMTTDPVIYAGANGQVTTTAASSIQIKGAVISAPNASGPDGAFLGIEFSAD
jgi:hypothetical protein